MNDREPRRVSITGVDGAGKDTARRIAMDYISRQVPILYIGKPSLIIKNGVEIPIQMGITRVLDELHKSADAKKNRTLISISNAMIVMFMWRYQEPYWSGVLKPELILSIRDGYADPAAYAPFYMKETFGKMKIPDRIVSLKRLHGSPFRDKTIFLDVDPVEAVRRIHKRFEAERSLSGLDRPSKWIHEHENLEGIQQIRSEFRKVLEHLGRNCGTCVVNIDASLPPREVGIQIANQINCELI